MSILKRILKSVDWVLLSPLLLLGVLSVLTIQSSTASGAWLSLSAKNQMLYFGIGIGLALLVSRISLSSYSRFSGLFYLGMLIALVVVLVTGQDISGSKRWLEFGGFRVQPSEFMKIALIMFMAKTMQMIQPFERLGLRRLLVPLMMIGLPSLLVLIEPDLGTSSIIFVIGLLILLLCNVDRRIIVASLLIAAISAPMLYQFGLKNYQRERVVTFLNPSRDPQGSGYNAIQSMIAIGSGRFLGKGYLKGTQSRLDFIPEQHTDFVFSAFAEEWGLLGIMCILALYALVIFRIYLLASAGPGAFATLFCLGFSIALMIQMFINIAMVSGLLPIVGTTLPFFSYGGSSLLANFLGVGICLGIKRQQRLFEDTEFVY